MDIISFLHLHEIGEGLYLYFTLSVCLSVCLSECEQNAIGTDATDADFAKWLLIALARTLLQLVT